MDRLAGLSEVASGILCAFMQDEISSLKSKLEECKGQLQSNEQMIRWLNNQVLAMTPF